MKSSGYQVVTTRAGATAMRDCATGEVMHPNVGPIIEAETLYIEPSRLAERLASPSSRPLVLFDVGLGAGSNAIAAWQVSEGRTRPGRPLVIISFDRTTDAMALAARADHASSFGMGAGARAAALQIAERGESRAAYTHWRLILGELPAALAGELGASADIVFWDPFSPRANPTLWTAQAFSTLRRACNSGATVHTYSAATSTRAAMLLAGFAVGIGTATGSKRETTVAATELSNLSRPLDGRWLERLARSSAPFPSDAPADAMERIRRGPQFQSAGADPA